MTDLEMTKVCAIGIGLVPREDHDGIYVWRGDQCRDYCPLTYDGDAMELVKRFAIELKPSANGWAAIIYSPYTFAASYDGEYAANRAIVECASKMLSK